MAASAAGNHEMNHEKQFAFGLEDDALAQAVQIDDFAQCVKEGRESPVPGEMGRRDMVIIEAIYRSAAENGRRIEIRV